MTERHSVQVLRECIDLQNKKANDYQNPNSTIKQSDYYPSGCLTILEIIHAKVLRMRSVMEAMQNDPNYKPNFESLEDSAKDLINYASFYVAYSRGKVDGQEPDRDFLNRKKVGEVAKNLDLGWGDIEQIWERELPPSPLNTDGPVDGIKSNDWDHINFEKGAGFYGEVGDSGRVVTTLKSRTVTEDDSKWVLQDGFTIKEIHPGVKGNLVDRPVDPRNWSIGARGRDYNE